MGDTASQLRKSYDKCFWDSLITDAKAQGTSKIAIQSEHAFQACATEERAIAIYLALVLPAFAEVDTPLFADVFDAG